MAELKLVLNDQQQGAFYMMEGSEQLGEMVIRITGPNLTVYHTEVNPKAEGKGYAKKMLDAMVDHARTNHLQVIPLCPYVHAQFKRYPEAYADICSKAAEIK